jgi:hypothetical protein
MELVDGWDALHLHIIAEDLARCRPGAWVPIRRTFQHSPLVEELNRLAANGWGHFVCPQDLERAAENDWGLRTRRPAQGAGLEVSSRRAMISRALAAVLRYDVSEWVKTTVLQTLLAARFGAQHSLGQILLCLMEDPQRFETVVWEGESWARARYRY